MAKFDMYPLITSLNADDEILVSRDDLDTTNQVKLGKLGEYIASRGRWARRTASFGPENLSDITYMDMSDYGNTLAIATETTADITVYDWTGNAWVKRPIVSESRSGRIFGLKLNSKGDMLSIIVSWFSEPSFYYRNVYIWKNGAWSRKSTARIPNIVQTIFPIKSFEVSADGLYQILCLYGDNIIVYEGSWQGDDLVWIEKPNPFTTQEHIHSAGVSKNGKVFGAVSSTGTGAQTYTIDVIDRIDNSYIKQSSQPQLPDSISANSIESMHDLRFSYDGSTLSFGWTNPNGSTRPIYEFIVYDWADSVWTYRPLLGTKRRMSSINDNGKTIVLGTDQQGYGGNIYDWVEGLWIKRPDPSNSTMATTRIKLSVYGDILAVTANIPPYICVYKWLE